MRRRRRNRRICQRPRWYTLVWKSAIIVKLAAGREGLKCRRVVKGRRHGSDAREWPSIVRDLKSQADIAITSKAMMTAGQQARRRNRRHDPSGGLIAIIEKQGNRGNRQAGVAEATRHHKN